MPTTVKKVRVFVASPGDVQMEREQFAKVVNELNLTISAIAPEKEMVLELVRWETHVHPGLGKDAQEVVNQQIGEYDIFVGIIWKRLGTPTTSARSGTEEEFQRAYSVWQKDRTLPVLFYFCQQSFPPPRTKEEVEQLGKVVDFRDELMKRGLVADYADHESFADVIRPHLLLVIGKMFSKIAPAETAEYAAQRAAQVDTSEVSLQVSALTREYEHIRETMESGHHRTRQMEIVFSKMRTLALSSYPLLQDLARSSSAGQRLAAISILQAIPNPEYLLWLAERLRTEKPFLGYHAAVALLSAVRSLHASHASELRDAIATAKRELEEGFGASAKNSDRLSVLNEAQNELQHLTRKDNKKLQNDEFPASSG
ncbi:MAG TPA: DUF4062 domain-containing protein [Pyrinomonadaceae bacterium]|nr:DUF4062 domain-containing protein [Pyrinomonadaceae bacterium]